MTIIFYPTWLTPVGNLSSVIQAGLANIQLSAVRIAQCMGDNSSIAQVTSNTILTVGSSAQYITSIMINGVSTAFTIIGNSVQIAHTVLSTDIFSIFTSETISYSLLYNSLPPGLTLNAAGNISGLVGTIYSTDPLPYTFAVRITDGIFNRDQQFTIMAIPVLETTTPPGWGSLPAQQISYGVPQYFQYYPLGSTNRGEPFFYQFSLYEPSGLAPHLFLSNFTLSTTVSPPFNKFPDGLVLDNRTGLINGAVSTALPVGRYFFKITMTDSNNNGISSGSGATPLNCMIQVNPPYNALAPFEKVVWTTPVGSLGTLVSGTSSSFSVNAFSSSGDPVTYQLLPSSIMPPGLSLNSLKGDINGNLGYISTNQDFTFTLRALVAGAYADRTFSISTKALYNNNSFIEVDFLLGVADINPMKAYYSTIITPDQNFRNYDSNFNNTYSIFLIKTGVPDNVQNTISNSNYHRPIKLLLGDHKIAYAKNSSSVAYEVLYRSVIDPLDEAGDYTIINNIPISTPVIYPESLPNAPQYVYPTSINNIRNEFVNTMGIPASNPNFRHALGLNTAENLPLWMTSPQVGTDPTSALGYTPALIIAYLKPGTGKSILNTILQRNQTVELPYDPPNPLNNGYEISFDQYSILFPGNSTTFDNNLTTFDLRTTFTTQGFLQQQLIRMPPYV